MNRSVALVATLVSASLVACSNPATPGDAGDAGDAGDVLAASDAGAATDALTPDSIATTDAPAADGPALDAPATDAPVIVFQCAGLAGGICQMRADGTNRVMLRADGRCPDRNAAGEILFHDDSYVVHRRASDGSDTALGAGAFARWAPDGTIVFQCAGLGGGLCEMRADGSARRTLLATGRVPDRNAAGDIVFHDDGYVVQVRGADGALRALGAGANAEWTADGAIAFQCAGLGGGICEMRADGAGRVTVRAMGRSPDKRGGDGLLYHDDAYTLHRIGPDGTEQALGAGAFARWSR